MTANKQSRGWLLAPAAIFVLALGLRLVYLGNIRDIGFFEQPVSDGYVYDQRARGIAAGDWLGPVDFVHAPLYAYLLGLIKIVGGESLWLPRVVQTLGGASACVLLFLACRRLFDLHVAGVAAIWLALYPPAIFFDGLIQKAGLTLLLSTLLLWLVVRSTYQPVWWGWGIVGLVLGLLILTRQNMLALAPLIIAWLWFGLRARPRLQRLQWAGLAALGVVLTLFPWALRNRVVTGEWVLTTPNLGQNFAMGNHPEATGTYLPHKRGRSSAEHEQAEWVKAAEKACDRPLSAREVSDYYFAAAAEWIKANPGAWLRLTLIKCSLVWGAYELPDTEDYYLYQEWSLLLRTLDRVLHFGVLCPLAAAGVVLTCQEWRRLWFLYGWLLLTTLAVAAFVVFARYRFPLVPVLLIFAAAGLVESIRLVLHYASLDGWHGCVSRVQVAGIHGRHGRATHQRNVDRVLLRRRQLRLLLAAGVTLIPVAVAVNLFPDFERRPYSFSYRNHAVALADQGRYDDALSELRKAMDLSPDNVDVHLTMGSILLDIGRFDEALAHFEHARAGDPRHARTYRGLGDALMGKDRFEEAAEQYRRAVDIDPEDYVSLNCLATAYARQGHFTEAFQLFQQVLLLSPQYPQAHLNLGNTYLMAGRPSEAAAAYERALHYQPDYADAQRNLVYALLAAQEYERALAFIETVLEAEPSRADMLALRETVWGARDDQ